MIKIYTVLYNEKLSSEGYDDINKAITFIEDRSFNPLHLGDWSWVDDKKNIYKIKTVTVI